MGGLPRQLACKATRDALPLTLCLRISQPPASSTTARIRSAVRKRRLRARRARARPRTAQPNAAHAPQRPQPGKTHPRALVFICPMERMSAPFQLAGSSERDAPAADMLSGARSQDSLGYERSMASSGLAGRRLAAQWRLSLRTRHRPEQRRIVVRACLSRAAVRPLQQRSRLSGARLIQAGRCPGRRSGGHGMCRGACPLTVGMMTPWTPFDTLLPPQGYA